MNTYYNTTGEKNPQLELFKAKASTQDKAILMFFQKFPTWSISASDIIVNQVCAENTPITSVRRSLNTLVKALEIMPGEKKESLYGRPEFTYQLNKNAITK